MKNSISIVIPAKNEEKMIGLCIESAINALRNVEGWEIILVDSYSTDKTVEIAKQYPIKILRLKKEWFKSPHAGRYIGTIYSSGELIFFLDADMIVEDGWIEAALEVLEQDDKLAGVTGIMYNVLPNESINKGHVTKGAVGDVEFLAGPSLYKKKILIEVDHFNPFFKGNGEREIGFRISEKGYLQKRIDKTICYHFKKEYDLNESIEKAGYFIGVGQFLRLHFNKKFLVENIVRYKMVFLSFLSFSALIVLTFAAIAYSDIRLISYPIVIILLIVLTLMIIKSPKKTLLFMNGIAMATVNVCYGYLKTQKRLCDYPVDVEVVK